MKAVRYTEEQRRAIAALMQRAVDDQEGMHALAAAIAAPIQQEVDRKEITSLLLTEHLLNPGDRPVYQISPKVSAFYIADGGEARKSQLGAEEIEAPILRVHTNPMVDVEVLRNGNIGSLMDIQMKASKAIQKVRDERTIRVISAAVPSANTISVAGGTLTAEALNAAISLIEDQEMTVKYIIMRGRRFNDMRNWTNLSQQTQAMLEAKGVISNYGTGGILLTAAAGVNEIILVPDEEIGKSPIRTAINVKAIDQSTDFETGWLVWESRGQVVTNPQFLAKIVLLGANNAPTASISTPSAVGRTATVTVTAGDADDGVAQTIILWGDVNVTTNVVSGQAYSHTYAADGTYRISAVVTDAAGQTATDSDTVTVAA